MAERGDLSLLMSSVSDECRTVVSRAERYLVSSTCLVGGDVVDVVAEDRWCGGSAALLSDMESMSKCEDAPSSLWIAVSARDAAVPVAVAAVVSISMSLVRGIDSINRVNDDDLSPKPMDGWLTIPMRK